MKRGASVREALPEPERRTRLAADNSNDRPLSRKELS
jgi:hypothetical protein